MKALGKGFSAAPFKTFTIRSSLATTGTSHLFDTLSSEVCSGTSAEGQNIEYQ